MSIELPRCPNLAWERPIEQYDPAMPPRSRRRRRATPEQVGALGSPTRLRILRLTLGHPMTNQEIAARLRLNPATTLYHVRRLVEADLLEQLPPRARAAGGVEVPYVSRGASWSLDIVEDDLPSSVVLDAFLAEVREVGVERLEQVVRMRAVLTRKRRRELARRLVDLLDDYAEDDAGGEPWSLFFAMHPDPASAPGAAATERDAPAPRRRTR
jgi:DNA-binding transcriptional ArsR family regulator